MYKTVLFDLDGTLLNTIDDLADSANRVCAAHGWPQNETAQYRYFVGNGIPKLVERFSPASCRSPEQLAATLAEFDKVYGAHMHDKTAIRTPAAFSRASSAGMPGCGWRCSPTRRTSLPAPWSRGTLTPTCLRSSAAHCPTYPRSPPPRGRAP